MTRKHFLTLVLIHTIYPLLGQITYAPVFINPCSQEEELAFWYLINDTAIYQLEEESDLQSLMVPDTGMYNLHYNVSDHFPIHITAESIQRDTFHLQQLTSRIYVSNPSFSEFLDCDSLAQGKVVTYYYNGQKRAEGSFDRGQPTDTLFYYYKNGHYKKITIDQPTYWERIEFYETGAIASTYNTKKRQEQQFYPTGQLQKVHCWKKNFKNRKTQQYYEDGRLQLQSNHRQLKAYNQQGVLVESKKRKAIFVLQRWFANDPYDRHNYTYAYNWNSYDSTGTLQRTVQFHHNYLGSGAHHFPTTIERIKFYQFEEIFFYKDGLKVYKIDFQRIQKNEEWIRQLCTYRFINNQWVLEATAAPDQIHTILSTYK